MRYSKACDAAWVRYTAPRANYWDGSTKVYLQRQTSAAPYWINNSSKETWYWASGWTTMQGGTTNNDMLVRAYLFEPGMGEYPGGKFYTREVLI